MMTLKDVKDWLKTQVSADVWKIGTYDVSKDKTVCARNLTLSLIHICKKMEKNAACFISNYV